MLQFLAKLLLLAVVSIASLIVAEGLARVVVDPVNFLVPEKVPDPHLRHRVTGGSGGHDDWGFRNVEVPETSDIVAIGDSQTYGNTAAAHNSWPAWLERESGRSVYNLGMGGWGPLEYLHILKNEGMQLQPEVAVVGLYLGNDLFDATRSVYELDYHEARRTPAHVDAIAALQLSMREGSVKAGAARKAGGFDNLGFGVGLRRWLRMNSVLYRMSVVSLGQWVRPIEVKYLGGTGADVTVVNGPDGSLKTVLAPLARFRGLNTEDLRIQEGLRITETVFPEMARVCRDNDVQLIVVIIPTKIRVWADYALGNGFDSQREIIEKAVENEVRLTRQLEQMLERNGIVWVNALEPLRGAIEGSGIYPLNADGHPSSGGYRVIAKAVAGKLAEQ